MSTRTAPATRRYRTGLTTRADIPTAVVWLYRDHLRRAGEHRIWQGPVDHAGTPVIGHDYFKYSVLRVAWILHYDSPPDGAVRSDCGTRGCVAARCLTDQRARQRLEILKAALRRIDMTGTCTAGHPHAEHASVRTNGQLECRVCDNTRRRAQRAARQEVE